MALDIKESFEIGAPIDAVWAFLNDPHNVCGGLISLDTSIGG